MDGSLASIAWRPMRSRLLVVPILLLALAGCGGDGGGSDGGEERTAGASGFIECFDKPGFEAVRPKPREESVLAYQAKSEGYKVEPVNVQQKGQLTPHAFIVFFESAEKATEAMKALNANSLGSVPPQRLGPAVIGYGDEENRAAVEPAIKRCIPA